MRWSSAIQVVVAILQVVVFLSYICNRKDWNKKRIIFIRILTLSFSQFFFIFSIKFVYITKLLEDLARVTSNFLAASFRSHAQRKELFDPKTKGENVSQLKLKSGDAYHPLLPLGENSPSSPNSAKSFGDTQLEIFNHQHGMLILHVLAALMFVPSLVAWFQRIGMGQSFPWFLDSALCVGVILHGLCGSKPELNSLSFPFPAIQGREAGMSFIYLLAGYYSYLSGLALAPYRTFYAMSAVGAIFLALSIIQRRSREKGGAYFSSRKHSHRH